MARGVIVKNLSCSRDLESFWYIYITSYSLWYTNPASATFSVMVIKFLSYSFGFFFQLINDRLNREAADNVQSVSARFTDGRSGAGIWTEIKTQSYHGELCFWLGTTLNDKQFIIVMRVVIMVKFMLTGWDDGKCSPLYVKYQPCCVPCWRYILLSLDTILTDWYFPQTSLVEGTGVADDLPFLLPCMGDCWETLGS